MKQVKEGEVRKNTLKAFPGTKANQLNHYVIPTLEEFDYDCAIIHIGINDILRSTHYDNDDVHVSSILPSTRTI